MPDGGSTAFLTERVGSARAAELCMLGDQLPAAEAARWGLVHHIAEEEPIEEAGLRLAHRLAESDPVALGQVKSALVGHRQRSLRNQLELEADLQQRHGPTSDYAEGLAAFKARRPARFIGA
jgi:enoyl-CoA hydratase/carnithine racemase